MMDKIIDIVEQTKIIYMNRELNFYCKVDQDSSGFILSLFFSLLCWSLSKISGNYSWVDRFWSILPTFYTYHFSFHRKFCHNYELNNRQLIINLLSTLWSIRLTYNFYRKGGYNPGGEDYRWQIVKQNINNYFLWELLNIFFISLIQNILLYLIATPISLAEKSNELNIYDFGLILVYLLSFTIETIADQQQWNFQEQKKRLIHQKKELTGDFKKGFLCSSGLFRFSRHPNFFAEMCIWWVIYCFSITASGQFLNWTVFGTFFLTLLFQASTKLTEDISIRKYPGYLKYQKTTSRFIPLPSSFDKDE